MRTPVKILMACSLCLNVGVLAAVGLHYLGGNAGSSRASAGAEPSLPDYLALTPEQRAQWHAREARFVQAMNEAWTEMRQHRESMIRQIFSPQPNAKGIEAERAAISRLQEQRQRELIAQLMEEQKILTERQRSALADLLIRQVPATSLEESLHSH